MLDGSQVRSRGNVNGNVLVPAPDERTPLATDPARRAYVQRLLDAYPNELPNRTDINPRALNTNDIQSINNDRGSVRLRQAIREDDELVLHYSHTGQKVDAFQLVGGQNPDTTTKNHVAAATWNRTWSPTTNASLTAAYERVGSLLVPEESAVGPLVLTGFVVEFLGPSSNIPIDRALNRFTYAARAEHLAGNHKWTFGAELTRRQVNGSEAESHRGLFFFRNDFGRDAITNIRLGTPSVYRVAVGSIHRGFRNWAMQYYMGDEWKATKALTLSIGLRFEPVTAPAEVQDLTEIPYDCDCNNFAPRFGFAYDLGSRAGVLRGSYGIPLRPDLRRHVRAVALQSASKPQHRGAGPRPDRTAESAQARRSQPQRSVHRVPDGPGTRNSVLAPIRAGLADSARRGLELEPGLRGQPNTQAADTVVHQIAPSLCPASPKPRAL